MQLPVRGAFEDASAVRLRCRDGSLSGPTSGLAPGFVQANLVILPRAVALDFWLFCHRNPQACPVLEVTAAGQAEPRRLAPGADVRCDLPRYHVYRRGVLTETPCEIQPFWRDDLVCFLLGCSFSFENALLRAGLPVRHIEQGCNVPMFRSTRACETAGPFEGPLVVSMRPMPRAQVIRAVEITAGVPHAHGAPVQLGAPEALGIKDLQAPDFGDPVRIEADELPLFWACGVTALEAVRRAAPELAITHAPGHMFVTDMHAGDRLC